MKGKSDCGWKPEKAPGRALPASLSSCLSHALKKLRQSDRGQSEWELLLGNGQIMNLTSNAFVQREGSGNRFGWCRHRGEKRLGCRPRLSSSKPNQGTTSSAGIMIFQLLMTVQCLESEWGEQAVGAATGKRTEPSLCAPGCWIPSVGCRGCELQLLPLSAPGSSLSITG